MKAAERGDLKTMKANLAELGKKDVYGETALMKATCSGHHECISLLEKEIGMQDEDDWTALMRAAYNGHSECIPLLEKEIGVHDNDGWTALMQAVLIGNTDCVRLLLSEAGKQSTKERNDFPSGTTALMIAAYWNRCEIAELLLSYEQGLSDSEGRMAQWYANNSSREGDFTQVRVLLQNEGVVRVSPPSKGPAFLQAFAAIGDVEGVRKYLSHVGHRGPTGTTALMKATEKGHTECIPLLEKEIGMQDDWGWTALMLAAFNGYVECIPLLERELRMWNGDGLTALMLVAEKGHANCILPLEREIGMQDNFGWTALMWATWNDHNECIRHLLSEVGKQSTRDWEITLFDETECTFPSGMTALMLAAHCNHPGIIELLLPYEQGMKDSKGRTAKWYANNGDPERGDYSRVRKLLENEDIGHPHMPSRR